MGYSETDVRLFNEYREAVCKELATRLPEKSIKFVAAMIAPGDKPENFKLLVRACHLITSEKAELETKVKLAQMRRKESLEPMVRGVINELVHYFHGGDRKVIELSKPGIIH